MDYKKLYIEKNDFLGNHYTELEPLEFYRELFPAGSFERAGHPEDGKANGIISIIEEKTAKNRIIFDDLQTVEELKGQAFAVAAPISYAGRRRVAAAARWLYAITIDLDGVGMQQLNDLLYEMENKVLPFASYIINSGHGLHLYYKLEEPIALYPNLHRRLTEWKYALTRKVWNRYTSTYNPDQIQYQGIFQGYRIVGSASKLGADYPVKAFKTGGAVSVEYLNRFIEKEEDKLHKWKYQDESNRFEEAAAKYPDWAEKVKEREQKLGAELFAECMTKNPELRKKLEADPREPGAWVLSYIKEFAPEWYRDIIKKEAAKKEAKRWTTNRAMYSWWLKKIYNDATLGHRYHCICVLAAIAIKCEISEEELRFNCLELLEHFEKLTKEESNHFTLDDIEAAMNTYQESYVKFSRAAAEKLTGIKIPKTRRNGKKRAQHLEIARAIQDVKNKQAGKNWRDGNGRPKGSGTAELDVLRFRMANPEAKPKDCIKATGLSKNTVYKWWGNYEN